MAAVLVHQVLSLAIILNGLTLHLFLIKGVSGCSFWYDRVPRNPLTHCNPQGVNISLTCNVYVPRQPRTVIRWYWSNDEAKARKCGLLIDENANFVELTSTRAAYSISATGNLTGLYFDRYELILHNFSTNHEGYYWCQIVVNDTLLLEPSDSAHLRIDDQFDECGFNSYQHGLVNRKCAAVDYINLTCTTKVSATPYLHNTNSIHLPYSYSLYPPTASKIVAFASTATESFSQRLMQTPEKTACMSCVTLHFPSPEISTSFSDNNSVSDGNAPNSPLHCLRENYRYALIIIGGSAFISGVLSCFVVGGLCQYIHRRPSRRGQNIAVRGAVTTGTLLDESTEKQLSCSPNKIITEAEVEQTKAEDRKEDQQYATIKHRHKQVNEIDGYEIVANAKCHPNDRVHIQNATGNDVHAPSPIPVALSHCDDGDYQHLTLSNMDDISIYN